MSANVEWRGELFKRLLFTGLDERMDEVAQAIADEAKSLAPVRTGALRDSIEWIKIGDERFVGAGVPYAMQVEYGTSRSQAQPFLRPAIVSAVNAIRAILSKEVV
ncbi:MAG: HK97-gp10 family putative phage morphogenesis protein [Armatimonadota bacterium]